MRYKKYLSIVLLTIVTINFHPVLSQPPKPYEGVELYVALMSLPQIDFVVERVPLFEAETGIKVHVIYFPELELREKIVMDCATGAGVFDVIGIDNMYVPEFAEAGWIVPIEDYLPKEKVEELRNDILPKFYGTNSWKGKLYAIPLYGETIILMYRKDLFEKEGLEPPKTMEKLEKLAKHFYRPPELYGIAMRGLRGEGMNVYIWTSFLRAFGGKFF